MPKPRNTFFTANAFIKGRQVRRRLHEGGWPFSAVDPVITLEHSITRNDPSKPPRDFSAYTLTIDRKGLPEGVEIIEK